MAIYRSVHVSFWTDTKIAVEFTPKERYFYLYLLTNPHTSICGCYEISVKQIAAETGLKLSEAQAMLGRLVNVHRVVEYDEATRELFIIRWHVYNWNRSPNCRKAIEASIKEIKNTAFAEKIRGLARGLGGGGSPTVTEAVPVPVPVTETEAVFAAEAGAPGEGGMTLRSFPAAGGNDLNCLADGDDDEDEFEDDGVSVLDADLTVEELAAREEWLKNYIAEVRRMKL